MNLLCEDTLLDSGNTGQTSYFMLEDLDQTTFSFSKMKEDACEEGPFRLLIRYSKKLDYGTKPLFLRGERKAVGMRAHHRQWISH